MLIPIELGFDEWLLRGSGGADSANLVDELLRRQPTAAECFSVSADERARRLHQRYWLGRWRVPGQS